MTPEILAKLTSLITPFFTKADLDRCGVAWPDADHEMGGSPFVKCTAFERRTERQLVYTNGPWYPDRRVAIARETAYDEDGWEYQAATEWRDLTEDEWTAALAAYEKALAEFRATGGIVSVPGKTTTTGTFVTEAGIEAHGATDGKRWIWLEWRTLC